MRVRRWSRSSAWPSSAPSSGSRRPRRRSSSATPSSCATASPAVGAGPRRPGAGVAGPRGRRGHHPHHPGADASRLRRSSTPRSPPSPVASVRRSWTGWSPRRSSGYDLADADPAADPEDGYLHVDPRHATIHDEDVHYAGTMRLEAELDLADALDLDRALAHGAASLKASAPTASLDARRSAALGDLARTQTALDLHAPGRHRRPATPTACPPPARSCSTPTSTPPSTGWPPCSGRPAGWRRASGWSSSTRSSDWCADSRTKVTVKPVIDLNADLSTPAYEVPDRIREQVILRDRTCVFPWCTRPGPGLRHRPRHPSSTTHADAEGRPQPGRTGTDNLAALCRFHHRLKTHTAWRYRMTEPGELRVDLAARPPLPTRPHRHHTGR